VLDRLQLDPTRQLVASQCSGALLVARLGLLGDAPACTDASTRRPKRNAFARRSHWRWPAAR